MLQDGNTDLLCNSKCCIMVQFQGTSIPTPRKVGSCLLWLVSTNTSGDNFYIGQESVNSQLIYLSIVGQYIGRNDSHLQDIDQHPAIIKHQPSIGQLSISDRYVDRDYLHLQ